MICYAALLFIMPSLVASVFIRAPKDETACANFQECCAKPGTSTPTATVTAFIRSWEGDIEWLPYCLRSLCTFGTAVVTDVRLVVLEEQNARFNQFFNDHAHFHWVRRNTSDTDKFYEKYNHMKARMPDYVGQQYDKMNADAYDGSDYIMYIDTDTIFHRQLLLSDVFVDGHKLRYPISPFELLPPVYKDVLAPGTAFVLDLAESDPALNWDFMRRGGLTYPRTMYKQMRETIGDIHKGQAFPDIIFGFAQAVKCPSEFEIMGAYNYKYQAQMFNFEDDSAQAASFPVIQFWSWGGVADHVNVIECLLEGKGKAVCINDVQRSG
eukprot:CAMPEP_0168390642 /NCGR_PEP_ID=MMETSP0228-20121227/17579_1 /TAXON_ID=133427 /ORGANISM="Protoceratium reticulatum, Strain CCCM 535 (=CCMP 1889)" /LENGTH=323 /DNA_ID=CAMNT_0008403941 /DNA_START=101 /DNA_END=1072 /DNA_ORIENTATION=-